MSNQDPAFPLNELNQTTGDICAQHFGMTLRDYFAAKALQGMLAHPECDYTPMTAQAQAQAAADAYAMAAAMLAARDA